MAESQDPRSRSSGLLSDIRLFREGDICIIGLVGVFPSCFPTLCFVYSALDFISMQDGNSAVTIVPCM